MSDISAQAILRNFQTQLDPEGIEVGVSRQALNEVLQQLSQSQAEVDELKCHVERLREIIEQVEEYNIYIPLHAENSHVAHYADMIALWCDKFRQTPSQSLSLIKQEVERETIELCARLFIHETEGMRKESGIVEAIRNLKSAYGEK